MVASVRLNGTVPGLNNLKNHHVVKTNGVTPEIKVTNGQLGIAQLRDTVLPNDDGPFHPNTQNKAPVAICGMAMRLPGGITSDADFWRLLVDKKDAASRVPVDRYNIDAFQSKTNKSGTIKTSRGYFLDHLDLAHFDASFFSMTRSEVEKLDPQHRLLLELTR